MGSAEEGGEGADGEREGANCKLREINLMS